MPASTSSSMCTACCALPPPMPLHASHPITLVASTTSATSTPTGRSRSGAGAGIQAGGDIDDAREHICKHPSGLPDTCAAFHVSTSHMHKQPSSALACRWVLATCMKHRGPPTLGLGVDLQEIVLR